MKVNEYQQISFDQKQKIMNIKKKIILLYKNYEIQIMIY